MKRNGNGKLWVYPLFLLYPSEGSPSSKFISSPPQHSGSPSKAWFLGSLKGFFDSRRPSTPQSSPTRQRSTKTTASATIITAIFNNRNLTSGDDSDVEDTSSPSKSSKGFQVLFGKSPTKHKTTKFDGEWKIRTDDNLREIK